MAQVTVRGGDMESALRLFKKRIDREGVLRDLRIRDRYVTKIERKKAKARRAESRRLRNRGRHGLFTQAKRR